MNKSDYVILVDMDDTIEDLLTAWVNYLDKAYNTNVSPDSITDWHMSKFFPNLTPEQLYGPLHDPELWKAVKPIPTAPEYLQQLIEEGFTVRICTASSPKSYALKMKHFAKKYLPFIDPRLQCICIHDKQMVKANVLLDDNYSNCLGGTYKGVLFNRSHNKLYTNPKGLTRVNTWEEFYDWVQRDFEELNS